jgi:hypothetical protein
MTPSRYLVIQCGGPWVIRSGNRPPAKVLVQEVGARGLKDVANRLELRTRLVPQHARQSCKWPGQRAYRLP